MEYVGSSEYPTIESLNNVGGIYLIGNSWTRNKVRIYIGQSKNLLQRYKDHCRELNRNKHHNQFLQNAYNKYGVEAFHFEILEIVDKPYLLVGRETYWIERFGGIPVLYNSSLFYDENHNNKISETTLGASVVRKVEEMIKKEGIILLI